MKAYLAVFKNRRVVSLDEVPYNDALARSEACLAAGHECQLIYASDREAVGFDIGYELAADGTSWLDFKGFE